MKLITIDENPADHLKDCIFDKVNILTDNKNIIICVSRRIFCIDLISIQLVSLSMRDQ